MEERMYCAKLHYPEKNCTFAKIVKVKGEFPVVTFFARVKDDGSLSDARNVKKRTENTVLEVYCTHPNCPGKKEEHGVYIGYIEPYITCSVPEFCPESKNKMCSTVESKKRKHGMLERMKKFLFG